jgi:hypothetical protein
MTKGRLLPWGPRIRGPQKLVYWIKSLLLLATSSHECIPRRHARQRDEEALLQDIVLHRGLFLQPSMNSMAYLEDLGW